jgi:hypothetical protein
LGVVVVTMDEAREAHRSMLRHAQAGERAEALAAAERYLALVSGVDDPELRGLTAGATVTWLSLKARAPSDELLPACEEIFERFSDAAEPEAVVVAVVALAVQVVQLLRSDRAGEASAVAHRLARFYLSTVGSLNQVPIANQMVSVADHLVSARCPQAALEVLRPVVDRLWASHDSAERHVATVAQLWLVIATMYSGELSPGAELPQDLAELQGWSEGALHELSPIVDEAEKLAGIGDDALQAIEYVMRRFDARGSWDRAILLVLGIKIETLRELERHDGVRAVKQELITRFDGIDRWNVGALIEEYKRDLGEIS